jgi:hypothetical protein
MNSERGAWMDLLVRFSCAVKWSPGEVKLHLNRTQNCGELTNLYLHGGIWEQSRFLDRLKSCANHAFTIAHYLHLFHLNHTEIAANWWICISGDSWNGIISAKFDSFPVRFGICEFVLAWSMQISSSWIVHWTYRWSLSDPLFRQIDYSCD